LKKEFYEICAANGASTRMALPDEANGVVEWFGARLAKVDDPEVC
jgi:hypothetical protein